MNQSSMVAGRSYIIYNDSAFCHTIIFFKAILLASFVLQAPHKTEPSSSHSVAYDGSFLLTFLWPIKVVKAHCVQGFNGVLLSMSSAYFFISAEDP